MTRSPSILLLTRVDHACGDIIASVTEGLLGLGVQNVNLVPSLTKTRKARLSAVSGPSGGPARASGAGARYGVGHTRLTHPLYRALQRARVSETEQQGASLRAPRSMCSTPPSGSMRRGRKMCRPTSNTNPVGVCGSSFVRTMELESSHSFSSRALAHRRPARAPCPLHRPSTRAEEIRCGKGRVPSVVWPEQERGRRIDDSGRCEP